MFYEKIALLNQTIIDCLNEADEDKVIRAFTELGITILDADFGFVWLNSYTSNKFELVYKSSRMPYTPEAPKEGGRNWRAMESRHPDFVTTIKKGPGKNHASRHMASFVIIPITRRGTPYGNIVLCFKKKESFPREKRYLSTFIGNAVADAITIHRLLMNEQDLRHESEYNEARFRALVENSHEMIMLVNKKGIVSYVSPAITRILKHKMEDAVGNSILDIVHEKDAAIMNAYIRQIIDSPKIPHTLEFRCLHKDGSICFLESTGVNLIDLEGVKSIALNIRDLTARKQAEKLIEQDRLLEQERSKTAFITEATHELRTPLAIIKGNVDVSMQEKGKNPSEVMKTFGIINEEVNHMSQLVADLEILVSSKGFSQRKIATHTVRLDTFLKRLAARCETLARKKHISIVVKKLSPLSISGDEVYLEKLFTNLIKNAILYGKNKGTVTITQRSTAKNKKIVLIDIADNGIGISKADLPHIFERFYRAAKAREVNHEGTGLGLAIVKWVTEVHGGTVTVKSHEGTGTTFTVSLPKI